MNMQGLLKQAQKMQKELTKLEDELNEKVYETTMGGGVIKVEVKGSMSVESISIDESLLEKDNKEDLEDMEGLYDEAVINKIYQLKGMALPEREPGLAEGITNFVNYVNDLTFEEPKPVQEKEPGGFFSKMAMAFGIGEGIRQGINDAADHPVRKFRVGDHVRVKYRGQEGTVIDINGDLYMVSLSSGSVDSYSENQLERAW